MVDLKRGDLVLVNLDQIKGLEKGGVRLYLIIQNDDGNSYSPLTIIAPLTTKEFTKEFPTNVYVPSKDSKLDKNYTILLNQIKTIDKSRIIKKLSSINTFYMNKVNLAIKISLDID